MMSNKWQTLDALDLDGFIYNCFIDLCKFSDIFIPSSVLRIYTKHLAHSNKSECYPFLDREMSFDNALTPMVLQLPKSWQCEPPRSKISSL